MSALIGYGPAILLELQRPAPSENHDVARAVLAR